MKFLIAAGGTGGHINPGIAIANEIKKHHKDAQIFFVGTERGFEKDLVPKAGYELKLINVKGFTRKLSFDTLVSIKELIQGLFQSRRVIKEIKPDIVIGTGGYVCGPVLLNASLMKIPTVIHEQNAFPGITNKILSRFVDKVLISFEESRKYLKSSNITLTGNPVRQQILNAVRIESRQKLDLKDNEKLILCYGGSNGAEKINQMMINYIKKGIPNNIKVIFGTGSRNYDNVIKRLEKVEQKNVDILAYIYNMHEVMSAADLIIGRAGALTLSEITSIGLPGVIIPSPNVADNHQEYNAKALENAGAGKMILEKDLENIDFKEFVEKLLENENELKKMRRNSKQIGRRDATDKIYKEISKML